MDCQSRSCLTIDLDSDLYCSFLCFLFIKLGPYRLINSSVKSCSLPQFLCDMGSNRIQQCKQCPVFTLCYGILLIEFIDQCHHGCDRCIILQVFKVAADLLNGLVQLYFHISRVTILLCQDILQLPYSFKESSAALHTIL